MYSRLIAFLDSHNLIYTRQLVFQKGHSTVYPLVDITECIRKRFNKGEFAGGVLVDLQKAFDTVNHKLDHYVIRGCCNDWFIISLSYL